MKLGDALLDEISESQRSKWQDMIESTDVIHSSLKAWKTIKKLTKDYAAPQQQYRVTADQVAHQLIVNGKGKKTTSHKEKKRPKQDVTECNGMHADITIQDGGPAERYHQLKEQ